MSSRKLRFVPLVRADLREHERYTRQHWGEEQRPSLNRTFGKAFGDLVRFPEIGRQRDDLGVDVRTLPIEHFVIVYRIDDVVASVVRVLHERQVQTEEMMPTE